MVTVDPEKLESGIRALVMFLNDMGFTTVKSGDGSTYGEPDGSSFPFPFVVVKSYPDRLVSDAIMLLHVLRQRGVTFSLKQRGYVCDPPKMDNTPAIMAAYDPQDGTCEVLLRNVLSRDVFGLE